MSDRVISEVLKYCLQGKAIDDERDLKIAIRRFVAVVWLIQPGLLRGSDGKCLTLERLGELPFLDCTRCSLSLKAQEFAKRHGFHSSIQKRTTAKGNYANSAHLGWVKRRTRKREEAAVA